MSFEWEHRTYNGAGQWRRRRRKKYTNIIAIIWLCKIGMEIIVKNQFKFICINCKAAVAAAKETVTVTLRIAFSNQIEK